MMIAFRVDGNSKIGSGHVMRCLSIAAALKKLGKPCIFITADDSMHEVISMRGFEGVSLNSLYDDLEKEIDKLLEVVKKRGITHLVVDSYFVSAVYFDRLRSIDRLTYIDDLIEKPYPVDTVINYNAYANELEYKNLYLGFDTKFLIGTKYVPLREEFSAVDEKDVSLSVEKVLILTGGADPEHVALRFAREIEKRKDKLKYRIVAGGLSKDLEALKDIEKRVDNLEILSNVTNMCVVMGDSDIAVTATGSTLYELFACGVPVVTYVLADNQIRAASLFPDVYAGDARAGEVFLTKSFSILEKLCGDKVMRGEFSSRERELVDGEGSNRIAMYL